MQFRYMPFIFFSLFFNFSSVKAAGCSGDSCLGKDPVSQRCGNVRTLTEFTHSAGRVQIRYSGTCRAAWARLIPDRDGDYWNITLAGIRYESNARNFRNSIRYRQTGGKYTHRQWSTTRAYSNSWSPMVPYNFWGIACINTQASGNWPSYPFRSCSNYVRLR